MRKAFISPTKYVQGENELLNLGYFVKIFGDSALLIAHPDDVKRVKHKLDSTIDKFNIKLIESNFQGECSREEVNRLQALAKEHSCSCTIGLGGGKAIDAAKCVAEGEALIIVPTIAATDAPTSHSAVLYTPDGQFDDYAYFKQSPSVVMIDTTVIANAPTRFLVAGMGDALSTYFEARATSRSYSNVNAGLPCGVREGVCGEAKGTNTALALAKFCYETLMKDGIQAKIACDSNMVTPALENIIETNILLSGLGFESGGLAAAHAIHNGLTTLEGAHHFYHGEKVAFTTICQLVLENADKEELDEVLAFCSAVGLPICLPDLGVDTVTYEELLAVAKKACIPEESIHSMPFPITEEAVASAIMVADQIGRKYKQSQGELYEKNY
ncbi:glycerol dehydrogenase [Paenibacillus dakarensis]|uniref:glycerol dehydrogenase n=1 Tax=Paenibacillus dakarensis TaxID=1527293 RepID=UPI0006D5779E|nr:glycerol dehydrogenase [Paenibacillus dakarensis]